MRISWEHDVDGLRTWAELEVHLGDAWSEVIDRRTGVVLTTVFDELHVDEPAGSTAAQRRALHRAGFRRRDERCWSWTPPEPDDLPPPPASWPASLRASWRGVARDLAVDRARRASAVLVLREVFVSVPSDLVVTVADEDDDWDEEEDDDAWTDLDCAALEARHGRSS